MTAMKHGQLVLPLILHQHGILLMVGDSKYSQSKFKYFLDTNDENPIHRPPMPTLILLNNEGVLCTFTCVNYDQNAEVMTSPAEQIAVQSSKALD
jgi:hypothetical protein